MKTKETFQLVRAVQPILFPKENRSKKSRVFPLERHRRADHASYSREEFEGEEEGNWTSDAEFLSAPSEEVMYGSPHSIIDNMPSMVRLMIEDPSWIYYGNRILRGEDPVTTAKAILPDGSYEFPNAAGYDLDEADDMEHTGSQSLVSFMRDLFPAYISTEIHPVILNKATPIHFNILEDQKRLIASLAGEATITLEFPNKVICTKILHAQSILCLDRICQITVRTKDEAFLLLALATEEDSSDDMLDQALAHGYSDINILSDETEEEESNESFPSLHESNIKSSFIPDLSSLEKVIPAEKEKRDLLWAKETSRKIPINEWILRKKTVALKNLLCSRLDSPYLSQGYVPPSPVWKRIMQEQQASTSEAADRRKELFASLLAQAKIVSSVVELYGPDRKSGFYGKIRALNQEDKDLVLRWSEKPTKIKLESGEMLEQPSSFKQGRDKLEQELIAKGIDKPIREKTLWHHFDRVAARLDAVYLYKASCSLCNSNHEIKATFKEKKKAVCPDCGNKMIQFHGSKLYSPAKVIDDSVWRQRKAEAFQDLNLTKDQWNTIYQQLEIQKQRIHEISPIQSGIEAEGRKTGWQTKRQQILEEVRDFFRDCTDIRDLMDFKAYLYKQIVAPTEDPKHNVHRGDIIVLSPIDQVTFGDERRIRAACTAKSKQLAKENNS